MNVDSSRKTGSIKILLRKKFTLSFFKKAEDFISRFSLTEKLVFYVILGIFVISALVMFWKVSNSFIVEVPTSGGKFTEGVVGIPRFINPLLAVSDADKDLTALVYSGLLRGTPNGNLVPDLAESYTVSPDGLSYNFIIRNNAKFQDGTDVTADDVLYTVKQAQNPLIKSPKQGNWAGISIEKISNKEVAFILKKPYAPFLENATLGILPKHLWNSGDSDQFTFNQYNNQPIGAGPYEVKSVKGIRLVFPSTMNSRHSKNIPLEKLIFRV